jgi:Protein of unknown function (DUF3012)
MAAGSSTLRSESMRSVARAMLVMGIAIWLAACAPEVGSERWCENMRDKPRGDWTGNEALDYARSCVL